MATALLMGLISTNSLAAHQVAIQCAAATFMITMGVGLATSVRVGQARGRGDSEGVARAGYTGIALSLVFMSFTAMFFWTFPRPIISLFFDLNNPANLPVIDIGVAMLGVAAVFQLFDGLQVTAGGALRGLKDTRTPMLIGLISYWGFGMSSGLILAFVLDLGAIGLWWGLVIGLFVASISLTYRFSRFTRAALLEPTEQL